jgi:hypothetical protein
MAVQPARIGKRVGSGLKLKIYMPKGAPGAYVNASGSNHPSEMEFIIPAGRGNFRVVEFSKPSGTGGRIDLTLEWIP